MRLLKVAAATLNQTPLDWERNKANILTAVQQAREAEVDILCLPELCVSGYGAEDAFLSPGVLGMASRTLLEIIPAGSGLVMAIGLPVFHNKATYNASALVVDGRIAGFAAKRALAGDGIHYEPRWFKPWPRGQRSKLRIGQQFFPIGDLFFDCDGIRIGFEICEDAWIAQRPGLELALDAVDVILNPSASHFAFGKYAIRRRLALEGSRAFGVSYVYANLLGNEAGRAIYDGDAIIATAGEAVAQGKRFSFSDVELLTAVVDVDLSRSRHAWLSGFVPHVTPESDECVLIEHSFRKVPPEISDARLAPWEQSEHIREEEFTRAICLSLLDYLRKSRAKGFVISLSGGADSTAVACLSALAIRMAHTELGVQGLRDKLSHMPELKHAQTVHDFVARLVVTAYQGTANSSEGTRAAARRIAEAIGARHFELDVEPIVQEYRALAEKALERELTWEHDDITLQNIQARVRAPSIWMLANITGGLLLSTSNRSEAAVGYATMDGDTAGGVSPIAGIDKAFLRNWLRWMEEEGPHGYGPIPELSVVNELAPTAELRPADASQTDEDDLMPYALLDAVERAAIRDKRTPSEVFALMRTAFPKYDKTQLLTWVERFFRLWSRNQWKRERYAPSFHVDDANLDPKTWCRFPILSGGFERELAELVEAVRREEE